MPIREFKCDKCDHIFEEIMFRSDMTPPEECPKCKSSELKAIGVSLSSAQFKGAGWSNDGYSSTEWSKKDSGLVRVGNPNSIGGSRGVKA